MSHGRLGDASRVRRGTLKTGVYTSEVVVDISGYSNACHRYRYYYPGTAFSCVHVYGEGMQAVHDIHQERSGIPPHASTSKRASLSDTAWTLLARVHHHQRYQGTSCIVIAFASSEYRSEV